MMEQLTDPIVRSSTDGAFSAPMQKMDSTIVLLTNPQNTLYRLELHLRNYRELPDGGIVQIPGTTPRLNEKGINDVMFILNSYVNPEVFMGHTEKDEIQRWIWFDFQTMRHMLWIQWREYEMNEKTREMDRQLILTVFINLIKASMNRTKEGGERSFWGKITHDYNIKSGDGQKGDSLFDKAKGLIGMKR